MSTITFTTAKTEADLQQILNLQKENLEASISTEELQQEGFVTIQHTFEILKEMNALFPHVIAKDKNSVIAYALVMDRSMEFKIPFLFPMFQHINAINYKNTILKNARYFIMGQVCIKKGYRGQGILQGLYKKMNSEMAPHFQYSITEVASKNPRSMRAHLKNGFTNLFTYNLKEEEWNILLLELKQR